MSEITKSGQNHLTFKLMIFRGENSSLDYYPFGMPMVGRSITNDMGYRFGFNGRDKQSEIEGNANMYDYDFRTYDPRLGRFISIDPLNPKFPWLSPYHFAGDNPIWNKDFEGLEQTHDLNTPSIVHEPVPQNSAIQIKVAENTATIIGQGFADLLFKDNPNIGKIYTKECVANYLRTRAIVRVDISGNLIGYGIDLTTKEQEKQGDFEIYYIDLIFEKQFKNPGDLIPKKFPGDAIEDGAKVVSSLLATKKLKITEGEFAVAWEVGKGLLKGQPIEDGSVPLPTPKPSILALVQLYIQNKTFETSYLAERRKEPAESTNPHR